MNNFLQTLRAIKNPNAFINSVMSNQQYANNPMVKNAFDMSQKGDINGLKNIAQNLARERGISLDEIQKTLGI